VSQHIDPRRLTRRAVLLGGAGAVSAYALRGAPPAGPATVLPKTRLAAGGVTKTMHLAATDGWVGIADPSGMTAAQTAALAPFWPDPLALTYGAPATQGKLNLYVFGFRDVTGYSATQVTAQRGRAQLSAPQLVFDEGDEIKITLTNLGLSQRPDLVDGHTIHWHGFVNAIPLFDGVPELSISVPIGRDFTYLFRPKDAGTYMYHCHFEDVEHVQMGMNGVVFVRPLQNGSQVGNYDFTRSRPQYAYNDGDGSTQYDREFGYMINEIFAEGHYRDAHIQSTDWTDYRPSFWTLNGRTYPDTLVPDGSRNSGGDGDLVAPAGNPRLQYQPITSLVQCNAGERVLLRMSSLGYQNHAMTVDDIDLTVVAKDASLLRNGSSTHYIHTNSVDVGPGESRDVIFTAPGYTGGNGSSGSGYDTYLLYDRDYGYASNAGRPGTGGIATQIRVYPPGHLGPQADPSQQPNA
jgi:FtsP/CotA-like multicopper oxidase with cupredoxin domain